MSDVRQATMCDIESMVELLTDLFSIEQDFHPDQERQRRGLRLLLESQQAYVVVAEASAQIIGMASVQILVSTAEGSLVGLVEDVVVDRTWRGRGVGHLLLEHLETWSGEKGLSRLQLLADLDNTPALAFYKSLGWSRTRMIAFRKALRNFV